MCPPQCFPTFHYRTFSFCCLPSFSSLEPSKPPPKDKQDFWEASSHVFFLFWFQRLKWPYSQPLFRKLFLKTYTTKHFRSIKRQIFQQLHTSFKNNALRNLSSHQLLPIETEILALGLNFVPTPPASTHYPTQS